MKNHVLFCDPGRYSKPSRWLVTQRVLYSILMETDWMTSRQTDMLSQVKHFQFLKSYTLPIGPILRNSIILINLLKSMMDGVFARSLARYRSERIVIGASRKYDVWSGASSKIRQLHIQRSIYSGLYRHVAKTWNRVWLTMLACHAFFCQRKTLRLYTVEYGNKVRNSNYKVS